MDRLIEGVKDAPTDVYGQFGRDAKTPGYYISL